MRRTSRHLLFGGWLLGLMVIAAAQPPSAGGAPGILTTVNFTGSMIYVNSVAVNPDTNRIYVVDSAYNDLIVVDGATNNELTRVQIGDRPAGGLVKFKRVAVDATANRVYVTNNEDNTLRVIDGVTNTVSGTIQLTALPKAVAVNPTTHRIYVATMYGVDVVDGLTNTVIDSIGIWSGPVDVAVNPVTNRAYVVVYGSDWSLNVIEGSSNKVTEVNLGITAYTVAVNPITNRIYVANNATAKLIVVNGINNQVITQVPVGNHPEGIAVDPLANRTYMGMNYDYTVEVLEGAHSTLTATVPVGLPPNGIAANPATDRVYLTQQPDKLVVIQDDAAAHDTSPEISAPSLSRKLFGSAGGYVTVKATVEDDHGVTSAWMLINGKTRVNLKAGILPVYGVRWKAPRNYTKKAKKYRIDIYAVDTAGCRSGPLTAGTVTVRGTTAASD